MFFFICFTKFLKFTGVVESAVTSVAVVITRNNLLFGEEIPPAGSFDKCRLQGAFKNNICVNQEKILY
jgi:hypothetical protein